MEGVNDSGNVLRVATYSIDSDDAARQYDFRYSALGYKRTTQAAQPTRRRSITLTE